MTPHPIRVTHAQTASEETASRPPRFVPVPEPGREAPPPKKATATPPKAAKASPPKSTATPSKKSPKTAPAAQPKKEAPTVPPGHMLLDPDEVAALGRFIDSHPAMRDQPHRRRRHY